MRCPVCQGTGSSAIPHIPAPRSSWPFKIYFSSESECGECEGRGTVENNALAQDDSTILVDLREYLGTITAYHIGNGAASMLLDGALRSGDRIIVVDDNGMHELEVQWMQWGKAWIQLALRGWMVTFPSGVRLQAGARVYRAA